MALFDWIRSDLHNLNLDWIISKIKTVEESEQGAVDAAADANASKTAAAASATAANNSKNAAAGSATLAAVSAQQAQNLVDQLDTTIAQDVSDWLENNLTPTSPPVDDTLTIQGAAADAKKTGDEITDLKTAIGLYALQKDKSINYNAPTVINTENGWECAVIACSAGNVFYIKGKGGNSTRLYAFYDSDDTLITSSPVGMTAQRYATLVAPPDAVKLIVNSNYTVIKGEVYSDTSFIQNEFTDIENINYLYAINFVNQIYFWNQGIIGPSTTRVGSTKTNKAYTDISIKPLSGLKIAVSAFSSPVMSIANQLWNVGWITTAVTVPKGTYFQINIAHTDDSTITPSEAPFIEIKRDEYEDGFVFNAEGLKKNVGAIEIGSITGYQSFCVYNNNYYSTEGTTITKQDSSFEVVSSETIAVGHGNAFSLGCSNIGYVSGWNDNKIYKINLDTMTSDGFITLPTTGYTTGVVDDVNGVAYILRRDDSPSTETNYNFITYDYVNDEIVSTKKLTTKFGALQDCEFYNGRIYVAFGLGTSAVPSGVHVYDVNGSLLAEYVLNVFASSEIEGIAINHETHELLISMINKKVYRITV